MPDDVCAVEIVHLPLRRDAEEALVDFLRGHPYFTQRGLVNTRILIAEDRTEIVLVLDWADHLASKSAIESDHGRALLEGLGKLVPSTPEVVYYGALT